MLPPEIQGEAYQAYLMYAYDGVPYDGDEYAIAAILMCYMDQLDSDREKYLAQVERARSSAAKRVRDEVDTTSNEVVTTSNEVDTTSIRSRDEVDGVSVSVTVSDITEKDSAIAEKKESKHRHGEHGHVLLTDAEEAKLRQEFGEKADEAIAYLDDYIELKGYKAKSHYLAIRKWVMNALREQTLRSQEIEQREARLKEPRARPGKGHFASERNDDLDADILQGVLERMTG